MTDLGKSLLIYLVCMIVVLLGLLLMFKGIADAHEWYQSECCSDTDCKPVKDGVVEDSADGGVDVKGFGHIGPSSSKLRESQDTQDHLCIHSGGFDTQDLKCVYHVKRGY